MSETASTVCPVCNSPVERAASIHCRVCEYRSEDAAEYLWTFAFGISAVALGFVFGAVAVLTEGRPVTHWRRFFADWCPIVPWSDSYHWLSFLVVGITLTLGGIGITRRRRGGWLLLVLLALYETILAGGAIAGAWGNPPAAWAPWTVLVGALIGLLLLTRVGVALGRLPRRSATEVQRRARESERGSRGGGTV